MSRRDRRVRERELRELSLLRLQHASLVSEVEELESREPRSWEAEVLLIPSARKRLAHIARLLEARERDRPAGGSELLRPEDLDELREEMAGA